MQQLLALKRQEAALQQQHQRYQMLSSCLEAAKKTPMTPVDAVAELSPADPSTHYEPYADTARQTQEFTDDVAAGNALINLSALQIAGSSSDDLAAKVDLAAQVEDLSADGQASGCKPATADSSAFPGIGSAVVEHDCSANLEASRSQLVGQADDITDTPAAGSLAQSVVYQLTARDREAAPDDHKPADAQRAGQAAPISDIEAVVQSMPPTDSEVVEPVKLCPAIRAEVLAGSTVRMMVDLQEATDVSASENQPRVKPGAQIAAETELEVKSSASLLAEVDRDAGSAAQTVTAAPQAQPAASGAVAAHQQLTANATPPACLTGMSIAAAQSPIQTQHAVNTNIVRERQPAMPASLLSQTKAEVVVKAPTLSATAKAQNPGQHKPAVVVLTVHGETKADMQAAETAKLVLETAAAASSLVSDQRLTAPATAPASAVAVHHSPCASSPPSFHEQLQYHWRAPKQQPIAKSTGSAAPTRALASEATPKQYVPPPVALGPV